MSNAKDEAAVVAQGEVLILLSPAHRDSVMEALLRFGRVSAMVSPRLVVLDCRVEAITDIRSLPGVLLASDQAVPLPLAGTVSGSPVPVLDEAEALFVAGWNVRRSGVPKQRIGDGLDWDAEGFEAPATPEPPKAGE